ncbi:MULTISPECIES: hypothetical protein [unclassified Streptomyces]|uniref:hypothetical protein n=1 Tax=unclassified Streptomyces TaxID=2593676 RepID=UPI00114D2EC3|nr:MULTISPECIES: hypothetical protein [unclassified Streptomyces]MYS19750.1 hypothetical protein [Streptomyces sp. SID4948]
MKNVANGAITARQCVAAVLLISGMISIAKSSDTQTVFKLIWIAAAALSIAWEVHLLIRGATVKRRSRKR